MRGCIRPLAPAYAVFDFKSNQNRLIDLKGNKKIICTMVKYGETFKATTWHLTLAAMKLNKYLKGLPAK